MLPEYEDMVHGGLCPEGWVHPAGQMLAGPAGLVIATRATNEVIPGPAGGGPVARATQDLPVHMATNPAWRVIDTVGIPERFGGRLIDFEV